MVFCLPILLRSCGSTIANLWFLELNISLLYIRDIFHRSTFDLFCSELLYMNRFLYSIYYDKISNMLWNIFQFQMSHLTFVLTSNVHLRRYEYSLL